MSKFQSFATMMAAAALVVFSGCAGGDATVGKRTDALDNSAWESAKWISAADAVVLDNPSERSPEGASWFVSTVKNDQKVISARWMTAGLGVYQLYVNGKLVGEEILKPGFTHAFKTKRSFTYDITDAFNTAAGKENTLAVQSTPGWWGDKIVTPGGHRMHGTKVAFRGVLALTYADGSTQLLGTNTTDWKAGVAGPVKHAGIFDGEKYDAREPMGFDCADKMAAAEENKEFKGEILPSAGAEIYLRKDLTMNPTLAYVYKDIEGAKENEFGKVVIDREYKAGDVMTLAEGETLVIDFGQNSAAVPSFTFKAAEGVKLVCLPAEILNDGNGATSRGMDGPEGSVHRTNLRDFATGIRLEYTFAGGDKYATYHPMCTFFGYRYISLTASGDVSFKQINSIPVTSIAKDMEIGKVKTGNELINKLISNTYWGQLSNYLSVSTDCPQRNERLGWTADTQVFTETGSFFANTATFFHKWMRDMRDSQSNLGGFPGVAPTAQYGDDMMRLGWADAGVIVPWTVWKQFNDTQIVDENWDAMEKFMNHVNETKYNHVALAYENNNAQWADWLSYEPLESCAGLSWENGQLKPDAVEYWNYLGACYWLLDARMMADMGRATGRDSKKYEAMADTARAFINETFLNADGTFKTDIFNTMQTPALFALKNKLVEGEAKAQMVARLRKNFEEHDNCLQTGFLGTSILMQTLTENGMVDIAYKLLFQRKNPSWLYSVDNGATTIWERWNSYMLDKGMGPKGMNSFNHYAYGCVCEWIWETAAGIAADPAAPGFKHIIMNPVPNKELGSIDAQYNSAAGLIKSEWHYEGDTWVWNITIPQGATATVIVPGEEAKEVEAGTYQFKK